MTRMNRHFVRLNDSFRNMHAAFERVDEFVVDHAGDLNAVFFRDFKARMRQSFRERSVVCEKNEPLAILIEASDREESSDALRHEVDDASASARIVICAERVFRLIERHIDGTRFRKSLAVDEDLLLADSNSFGQVRYRSSVDLNASFENKLLDLTPTPESGGGENLIESSSLRNGGVLFGVVCGFRSEDGFACASPRGRGHLSTGLLFRRSRRV